MLTYLHLYKNISHIHQILKLRMCVCCVISVHFLPFVLFPIIIVKEVYLLKILEGFYLLYSTFLGPFALNFFRVAVNF